MRTLRCLFALVLALPALAEAQGVLIAPTSVFISGRARTATLLLVNPNDQPIEVTLSTTYGYAITDSAGHFLPWLTDTPDSTEPSAASWIRIFPRRATIQPKAQQTVRLLVSPPAGLADGEYWARLAVLARGGQLEMSAPSDSSSVTIGLPMQVRTVLPVLYRNGDVKTGATVDSVRARIDGDTLRVRARIAHAGNAALLGMLRGTLRDLDGTVRSSVTLPVSVYAPIDPELAMPLGSVPAGRYTLQMEVAPGRPDLSPENQLPFRAARDSLVLMLP